MDIEKLFGSFVITWLSIIAVIVVTLLGYVIYYWYPISLLPTFTVLIIWGIVYYAIEKW